MMKLLIAFTALTALFAVANADIAAAALAGTTDSNGSDLAPLITALAKCKTKGIATLAKACQKAEDNYDGDGCPAECVKFVDALKKSTDKNCQAVTTKFAPVLNDLCSAPMPMAPGMAPMPLAPIVGKLPAQCQAILEKNMADAMTCGNAMDDAPGPLTTCPESCVKVFTAVKADATCKDAMVKLIASDVDNDNDTTDTNTNNMNDMNDNNDNDVGDSAGTNEIADFKACASALGIATPLSTGAMAPGAAAGSGAATTTPAPSSSAIKASAVVAAGLAAILAL